MPYDEAVKKRAYEIDPECWISYSGKPKAFKSFVEVTRCKCLEIAQQEFDMQNEESETNNVD